MTEFHVHMYGPPAAGKTVLLTAMNRHLPADRDQLMDVQKSAALNDQYERTLRGKPPEGTRPKSNASENDSGSEGAISPSQELLSYRATQGHAAGIVVRIVAHAGEDVLMGDKSTVAGGFTAQFANQPDQLLVVVLNPFKSSVELAGKAIRSMSATLQERANMNFVQAFHVAVKALFRLDPPEEVVAEFGPGLAQLLKSDGASVSLVYDPEEPNEEKRFVWSGPADRVAMLEAELNRFVETVVEHHRRYWDPLRQAAYTLENCIVVLTHVDLTELMPAVTATDFDEIFHKTFRGKAERLASQQLLAKMYRLRLDLSDGGDITPWQLLTDSTTRLHDYIMAFLERSADDIRAKRDEPSGELRTSQFVGFFVASCLPLPILIFVAIKLFSGRNGIDPFEEMWGGSWAFSAVAVAFFAVVIAVIRAATTYEWARRLRSGRFGDRLLRSATEVIETHPRRITLHYQWLLGRLLNFGYIESKGSDQRYMVSNLRECLRAWPKPAKKTKSKEADGGADDARPTPVAEHHVHWVLDAIIGANLLAALIGWIIFFVA